VGNEWAAAALLPSDPSPVRLSESEATASGRRRGASTANYACLREIRPAPTPHPRPREGGSGGLTPPLIGPPPRSRNHDSRLRDNCETIR